MPGQVFTFHHFADRREPFCWQLVAFNVMPNHAILDAKAVLDRIAPNFGDYIMCCFHAFILAAIYLHRKQRLALTW